MMSDDRRAPAGTNAPASTPAETELSKKLLSFLKKPISGEETIAWIKDINENLKGRVIASTEKQHLTMLSCIDTMFDHLERFTFEFNQVDNNTDLLIQCQRPEYGLYVNRCYGYLISNAISIVVQGEKELIKCFLIPTDLINQFDDLRENFAPFMILTATSEGRGLLWQVEGLTIVFGHLKIIAKKLFARLIRVARGETDGGEPFTIIEGSIDHPANDVDETVTALLQRVFQQNEDHISAACANLLLVIDQELETNKRTAVKVLQDDVKGMPKLMKRTEQLRTFRNMVEILVSESPEVFSER